MVGNGSMAWALRGGGRAGAAEETEGSGLRRRHSAPHAEDVALNTRLNTASTSNNTARPSIAASAPQTPSDDTITTGNTHVRFSADVDRTPPTTTSRRSSASPARPHAEKKQSTSTTLHTQRRPHAPELLLDTDLPSSSSTTTTTQTSPAVRSAPPQRSSYTLRSPGSTSPLSPGQRSRGYSLRRTIFARDARDASEHGAVVELERIESSSSVAPATAATAPLFHRDEKSSTPSKDKTGPSSTTVTISPVVATYPHPLLFDDHKAQPARGLGALPHYEALVRSNVSRAVRFAALRTAYQRVRKAVLRIQDIPPSKDGRHVRLNAALPPPPPGTPSAPQQLDERTGRPYASNVIRSSRYTAWNFVPKQLLAQFSKLANFYFLLVSVLQMIPGLSTTGTYTTIVPLMFFVSISIAKEGYDDLRRYRLDKEENNRPAAVLRSAAAAAAEEEEEHVVRGKDSASLSSCEPHRWVETKWSDVKVGDVVRLKRDEAVPADMVLLHSQGENKIAYVETMALDGETNLKSKQTLPSLAAACATTQDTAACEACVVAEDPNLDLYSFEGRVVLHNEIAPLTNGEVIYRGSVLRNTPEAIGLVIYSGEECKIRMNASKNPRTKAPSLQAIVNKVVVVIVCFVLALALFNTVAYKLWADDNLSMAWYLDNQGVAGIVLYVSFIIMFNTMIPLSLYVSLEIIKLAQMFLLNDIDMYDPVSDTPLEARTSTINEELGQVNYIFSDKTGTLTDNSMKFRKMSVAGTAWLHDPDLQQDALKEVEIHIGPPRRSSKGKRPALRDRASMSQPASRRVSGLSGSVMHTSLDGNSVLGTASPGWKSSARPTKAQVELQTREMIHYIQNKPYTVFARKARFFILSIALCHTCLPETHQDGTIGYQAASPDELALVQAAQELGYIAIDRRASTLTIKTFPLGPDHDAVSDEYEVLDTIEFSSRRKRMSVVVKLPDQRICIICKGADSVLTRLLRLADLAVEKTVEIERRASKRKHIEAEIAMGGRCAKFKRPQSLARRSLALVSPTSLGRDSFSSNRRHLRDEIDGWLKEREHGVDVADDASVYYTPRPSGHFVRPSLAHSDVRTSMPEADYELVEEALVVDEPAVIERCFQHIHDFATEGLRTLLYGYRFFDAEEYARWKKVYRDATTSLVDRQERIEDAANLIEKDLELAGATAIEDKLQKGVPETIEKLRRANIKMWMLTGDKRETAINIGHSCRLIKDYSVVTVLDHEAGEVEQSIAAGILKIDEGHTAHSVVVVDGQTLSFIEESPALFMLFLDLAVWADSVICCRASPSQKAGLVNAIRKKVKKSVTLAIGDGANDIAMIQEAHVGIGITGKEGLQAARTSDYSIAQFRFLSKLLLVHGRWNYVRTCKYVVATFWKEMTFYLVQALYQRWDGYTGTSLYENWSLSMFNTLFTSLPVIFLGIFEQDLAPATLLAVPELYALGQRNAAFNARVYLWWTLLAAAEAALIYFTVTSLFSTPNASYTTNPAQDLFPLGDLAFSAVVVLVSAKLLLLEMHRITVLNAIAIALSTGGWALFNVALSGLYSTTTTTPYAVRNSLFTLYGPDPTWWLTLLLAVAAALLLELALKVAAAALAPSDVVVFQSLQREPALRARFEAASALELSAGWAAQAEREEAAAAAATAGGRRWWRTLGRWVLCAGRSRAQRGRVARSGLDVRPDSDAETAAAAAAVAEADQAKAEAEVEEMLRRRFGGVSASGEDTA